MLSALGSAGPPCRSLSLFALPLLAGAAGDHDPDHVLSCGHRPALPLTVGRLLIEFSSPMSMERVQRENPDVRQGGKYSPPDCLPRQKVAILIPFRHREHHLKYWLHYLHPILRRQKVAYGIYIINQVREAGARGWQGWVVDKQALLSFALQFGEDTFNRAKLLNVGFMEALKDDEEYDCFIFSDVDLIPMDDRNLYRCYEQPRHFAVGMDKFGFRWVPWGPGVFLPRPGWNISGMVSGQLPSIVTWSRHEIDGWNCGPKMGEVTEPWVGG